MSLVKTFFIKDASLKFIPSNFIENGLQHRGLLSHMVFMVTLFKLSGNFLRDIFAKHLIYRLHFIGNNVFDKIYGTTILIIIVWNFTIF